MSQNVQSAPATITPVDSAATAAPKTPSSAGEGVYVPVRGGAETRSGELLLVEAYAVLWLILMGWLFMLWRKQSRIHARLDELEKVLDRADAARVGAGPGATKPTSTTGAAKAKAQPQGGSLP